jgi:hypothetical protein
MPVGGVAGFAYLVPNPEPDHGYADTNGGEKGAESSCTTAIAEPSGLNATPFAIPAGNVAGLEYLVPNPFPDHGYA